MAKRKKNQRALIETIQFKDVERAKRAVSFAQINQIRILIGLAISLVATGLAAYGIFGNTEFPEMFLAGAVCLAIPAYLIGGGIGNVFKIAWNITVMGWYMIPIFPLDVAMALVFFVISLLGLCLVPVIFVGLNFIQQKKTLDAARCYLAQCANAASAEY